MFNYILIPLDGSTLAEAAIPAALQLADQYNSHILLLRVISPTPAFVYMEGGIYTDLQAEITRLGYEEALAYLKTKQETLQARGYPVFIQLGSGEAAEEIVRTAQTSGVDAIVMSTHGRSGLQRWLLGSVAEKVLRTADVPVLLIRVDEAAEKAAPAVQVGELAAAGV